MTVTYVLTEDVGKVRALIADRPNADGEAEFTDEELQVYLDLEDGDLRLAAATALEAWAAKLAANAHDFMLGDYRERTEVAAQEMNRRAAALRENARTTPAFSIAAVPWDGPLGWPGRDILVNRVLTGDA